MTILYGIPNCDTIRKARAWLVARGIAYAFHDWRKDGVDPALLASWIESLGAEVVLNRAGTTFRKLPKIDPPTLTAPRAIAIMVAHPATIRRPALVHEGAVSTGFEAERYAAVFGPSCPCS